MTKKHRLGPDDDSSPFKAVAQAGFRVRKASLVVGDADKDFQAVLAYQGSMANIYLADRTTCAKDGDNAIGKNRRASKRTSFPS